MRQNLVKTCPLCNKDLERGVVKFGGQMKWESTGVEARKRSKEFLAGSKYYSLHRGVASAERCMSCGIVIVAP